MKSNRVVLTVLVLAVALGLSIPVQADPYQNTIDIYKKSEAVQPFFKSAYGYAVFPNIGKGGFVVGGAYGKGNVYRGGELTGEASMIKATFGAQIGGQVFSEMIFFEDKRAYEDFTSGQFEFDAAATAVAVTAGVQAQASTQGATAGASAGPATAVQAETKYRKGMAVFVHAKGGLMFEATIGGQKFSFTPK